MEEADRGVVCDDCGRFIREGPPAPDPVFEGREGYIHSLCETCLPHHECPEFEEKRRQMMEESRERMRREKAEREHPGQTEMFK
jgi:hypothetical protein